MTFQLFTLAVHAGQAVVQYGGGSGEQIKALAQQVQASVEERFGIRLSAEVNFV